MQSASFEIKRFSYRGPFRVETRSEVPSLSDLARIWLTSRTDEFHHF